MVSNMDVFSTILDYTGQPNESGRNGNAKSLAQSRCCRETLGTGAMTRSYSEQEETRVVPHPEVGVLQAVCQCAESPDR